MIKFDSFQNYDSKRDMDIFFNSGCGYCYKHLISKFLEGETEVMNELSWDPTQVQQTIISVMRRVLQIVGSFKDPSNPNSPVNQSGFFNSLGAFNFQGIFNTNSSSVGPNESQTKTVEHEDYDVIDTPVVTEASGVDTGSDASVTNKKKGWFW